MFSLEMNKQMPPKYSFALRDLANFLGIFEVTEEDLNQRRREASETSSNMSYSTQGPFKALDGKLDIIKEGEDIDESEEEQKTGREVGKRVKDGVDMVLQKDPPTIKATGRHDEKQQNIIPATAFRKVLVG